MLIHIIEDDDFKCSNIINFINSLNQNIEIITSRSVDSGIRTIVQNKSKINLILLDMTMPQYDLDSPNNFMNEHQNFGGKSILSQMKARKIIIPVVVITMFNSINDISLKNIEDGLFKDYSDSYKGIIFYSSKEVLWSSQLVKYIDEYKS